MSPEAQQRTKQAEQAEQLRQLAYKTERAEAARLAARQQIAPELALRQVLTLAAGKAGLEQLLAGRKASQQQALLRQQARSAAMAQRQSCRRNGADNQPETASGLLWQGWFDGSAVPNPGRIGIGALLRGPQGQSITISQPAGYGNSSEAEYLALTALLQAAVQAGATQLDIRGDSQVVVNDVNLTPQAIAAGQGASGLATHRQQVCALMAQIGKVELRWLPRHRNAAADQLAQQALELRPPAP